ncbi:MAG: fused MFS/spermidine synthase [Betaproteobacteria bacterium]|nr:fused MFS/spermidine synthase [Betaproteobacteria bacterium]
MKSTPRPPRHALIVSEEDGIRYLHFGSPWVQGAMRIRRPTELVLDYTQDMLAALLLRQGAWPKRALQIGLGTASLAKFLQRHQPACKQTIVEIDERVVRLAAHSFRFKRTANIRIEHGDGVAWLAESGKTFDLIFIDGFDADAKPGKLNARRFYATCRERLSDGGVLVVNLLRRKRGMKLGVERILTAFDNRVFVLPETEDGNTVVFAAAGKRIDLSSATLKRRATSLRTRTGLDLRPLLDRLAARDGAPRIQL